MTNVEKKDGNDYYAFLSDWPSVGTLADTLTGKYFIVYKVYNCEW